MRHSYDFALQHSVEGLFPKKKQKIKEKKKKKRRIHIVTHTIQYPDFE